MTLCVCLKWLILFAIHGSRFVSSTTPSPDPPTGPGWTIQDDCSLECNVSSIRIWTNSANTNYQQTCQPIICAPSYWSEWSAWNTTCDSMCVNHAKNRTRVCISMYLDGWENIKYNCSCPGEDYEIETCFEEDCTVAVDWSEWQAWNPCPLECGDNRRNREKSCLDGYGRPATTCTDEVANNPIFEEEMCNHTVECFFSEWGEWLSWDNECTNNCWYLNHTRERYCMPYYHVEWTDEPYNCSCPGDFLHLMSCNESYCLEPEWGEWSPWENCTDFCGDNLVNRTRECFNRYNESAIGCPGDNTTWTNCLHINCSFGIWSNWTSWTNCTEVCDEGSPPINSRSRTCESNSTHLWRNETYIPLCPDSDIEEAYCNMSAYYWEGGYSWNGWGECLTDEVCGYGVRNRTMNCRPGQACNLTPYDTAQSCSCLKEACPVDGGWTQWTNWTACSVSCGYGNQMRYRSCSDPAPEHNGEDCLGVREEEQFCNQFSCIVNASYSEWEDWKMCSKPCGNGQRTRRRNCTTISPQNGGLPCGNTLDTEPCNTHQCTFAMVNIITIFKNETFEDDICNNTGVGSFQDKASQNIDYYLEPTSMQLFEISWCRNGTDFFNETQVRSLMEGNPP